MKFRFRASASVCLALSLVALAPDLAAAQGTPEIAIQLNKVEKAGSACRMTFVTDNSLGKPLDALALDVVLFDDKGIVGPRLVLDMGAVPDGETKVVDFDVPDTDCGKVSRLLLNDVQSCTSGGQPVGGCAASVQTDSKLDNLPFDK